MADDIIVIVEEVVPDIVVIVEDTIPDIQVTVSEVGLVGPRGLIGSSGMYEHIQVAAASTWVIVHNLNTYPVPIILLDDEPSRPVWTDSEYPDANTVVLTFPVPVSGRAYV